MNPLKLKPTRESQNSVYAHFLKPSLLLTSFNLFYFFKRLYKLPRLLLLSLLYLPIFTLSLFISISLFVYVTDNSCQ